jgi:peptidoglycan/LPS O-acetylase OafA/YrhL
MKINYRPEIDGLRAIAVSLVVFYHAEITIKGRAIFSGGFIGVDIFFVISGYLITSIILKELFINQSFSFKNFYERRIRRILPVLLFVMLASMPFAWICLSPITFIDFSKSILYSLGFASNLYFYFSGLEYGELNGFYKPFLHTWSLAVEEQYYILFPLFFFIIFKYLKKYFFLTIFLCLVFSLLFADYGSKNFSSLNFYILPTRIWELLFGSILAYYEIHNKSLPANKVVSTIFQVLGLILIGYSSLFFDNSTRHPSYYTLVPVIGVVLIIFFSKSNDIINRILSSKIFVSVGLISYSLYLWHYPIFAFARITELTSGSIVKKLALIILIFLLSIFTYFFIERPFRNKKYEFKKILLLILSFSTILIIFNSIIISRDGIKERLPAIFQKVTMEETHKLIKNSINEECLGLKNGCAFNTSSQKKVFLIGDSHAASLGLNLKSEIIKKDYQFITYLHGSCGFFPGFDLVQRNNMKIDNNCNDHYFNKLEKILNKEENSIIIFGARLPAYLDNREFNPKNVTQGKETPQFYKPKNSNTSLQSSFKNVFNQLSKKNKIILIYPIPEFGDNVPRKIFNKYLKEGLVFNKNLGKEKFLTTSFKSYNDWSKSSFKLFDSLTNNNISRVYPHKLFCNNLIKKKCITHDYNDIFYFDSQHLSSKGAKLIGEMIMEEISKN